MSFVVFHSSFAREIFPPFCFTLNELWFRIVLPLWHLMKTLIIAIAMIASSSSSSSCARHDDYSHVTCAVLYCTPRQYSERWFTHRIESSRERREEANVDKCVLLFTRADGSSSPIHCPSKYFSLQLVNAHWRLGVIRPCYIVIRYDTLLAKVPSCLLAGDRCVREEGRTVDERAHSTLRAALYCLVSY